MPDRLIGICRFLAPESGLRRAPTNGKHFRGPAAGTWTGRVAAHKSLRKHFRPSQTGDPLIDALNNAKTVSDQAFFLVTEAMKTRGFMIGPELGIHNTATEALIIVEKKVREEMERRKSLVPIQGIREMCKRCLEAIVRRLKKLPQEQGPQCNPQNPGLAVTILEREVSAIIADAHRALEAM